MTIRLSGLYPLVMVVAVGPAFAEGIPTRVLADTARRRSRGVGDAYEFLH